MSRTRYMRAKDYNAIAAVIQADVEARRDECDGPVVDALANVTRGIADYCEADSYKFDRGLFYAACGIGPHGYGRAQT